MTEPFIARAIRRVDQSIAWRTRERLEEALDSSCAITTLNYATGGDIYVFGGTVRRVVFRDSRSGDLDLMVPNGDDRAFEALNKLRVPFQLNRQGHHRYCWNRLQIDVLQPREFYGGFHNVNAALRFFDLRINALALHLRSHKIIDPFRVLEQDQVSNPGINWCRWNQMSLLELAILAIRLLKIMHEIPQLRIPAPDVERLEHDVVPQIQRCDWSNLYDRFPRGKHEFLRMFNDTVLGHRLTRVGLASELDTTDSSDCISRQNNG